MKIKSYSKRNSCIIKEKVTLYIQEFSSGVYYVIKNRGGDYNHFITSDELVEQLNTVDMVAIESENKIDLHCHYQEQFDYLVHLIDAHENSFKYRRENELDRLLGL